MTKLEIDLLLDQQLIHIHDLIECMPTPSVWYESLDESLKMYNQKNYVNMDSGINYLRSGIRDFVFRLVRFARRQNLPEFMTIKTRVIDLEHIAGLDLDTLLSENEPNIKVYPKFIMEKIRDYQEQIDSLPKVKIIDRGNCSDCNGKINVDYENGSLFCSECGNIETSAILMFVEDRNTSQEGLSKSKSNTHKTSKHFETWMSRIMAIEHRQDIHILVNKIKEYFKETRVPRDLIDYKSIRKYLQNNGYASYYENIAWLLKEVTGRAPPELTEEEKSDIAYRFDVIITSFDCIRKDTNEQPSGRTYYPFFIYKIIETKFANYPDKLRLLEYIHIQQEKTLVKNENYYGKILRHANNERLSMRDP